jgi:hypothetical protein
LVVSQKTIVKTEVPLEITTEVVTELKTEDADTIIEEAKIKKHLFPKLMLI